MEIKMIRYMKLSPELTRWKNVKHSNVGGKEKTWELKRE